MTSPWNGDWTDDSTRDLVRTSLSENLYLEAGAGTGKTDALVTRLVELLATGTATPENIAAITFTRAAAFEMRSRLRSGLEARARDGNPEVRGRIATLVDSLDSLTIQTIHSFALSMLRERPLDVGLPPVIEPLDDIQASVEFDDRWNEWFTSRIENDEQLAPALGIAQRLGVNRPIDRLRDLAQSFGEMHQDLVPGLFDFGGAEAPTVKTTTLTEALNRAQSMVKTGPDPSDTMCKFVNDVVEPQIRSMLSLASASVEIPASEFAEWRTLKPSTRGSRSTWSHSMGGEEALLQLRELLEDLQAEIDNALSTLKRNTAATLLTTSLDFALEYAKTRRESGQLTFHDQLVLARELLDLSPEARARFRERFAFILVDEFQDTDPVQIDLVRKLAGDESGKLRPGSLFVVGDPKQSIYRFRGADPGSSRSFSGEVAASGQGLPLNENHRSLPGILAWVNTVFSGWLKEGEQDGQAEHRDLHADPESAERKHALDGPPLYWFGGERDSNAATTRKQEFESISEIAKAAGEGQFIVRDRNGEPRDSNYSDVAILVKRRTGIDILEDALVNKGIPYVFDSQAPLFTSQDVRDLHACLTAIDDPSDQVAILAAVRSPAYSCTDAELLIWKNNGGVFDYLADGNPDSPGPVANAFADLAKFHRLSRESNTATLIERFVREHMLREKALLTRRGPERARRLDMVVELASTLGDPASGEDSITLRDFTRWIVRQADENARLPERVSQGLSDNAVRVMTIHGAKGLEFPIVIMTSASGATNNSDSVRILRRRASGMGQTPGGVEVQIGKSSAGLRTSGMDDAIEEEAKESNLEDVRLLYVASTRARDHLFVSRYAAKARNSKPLIKKIEQHLAGHEHLWREWKHPGRTITPPARPTIPADTQRDHEEWKDQRTKTVASASRRRYTTPTALKPEGSFAAPPPKEPSVALDDEPVKPGRGGTEPGRAVHAVLQLINLTHWDEAELQRLAERMANEHGAQDIEYVFDLARAALATPTMARASEAARRHQAWREVSVAAPLSDADGELEGQIDLLFREDDGSLTLVDHKTDQDWGDSLADAAAPYLPQMGAYAWCVEKVTGEQVARAVLLFSSRARDKKPCEYEIPLLQNEMQRAAERAAELVSATPDPR